MAIERVQYLDANGKLITEPLRDYSRRTVRQAYASLDVFLNVWHEAEKKQALLDELGTPVEIVTFFGGRPACLAAIRELETALYQEAA